MEILIPAVHALNLTDSRIRTTIHLFVLFNKLYSLTFHGNPHIFTITLSIYDQKIKPNKTKKNQMKHTQTPPVYDVAKQVFPTSTGLLRARIPDFLVNHNSNYQALSSDAILYFTKDGDVARAYCLNKKSYTIDISIDQLWLKLNHRFLFRRVSEHLIVNTNHIVSINRNGRKLIFLRNGDEVAVDEHRFSEIINSVLVV